jgi:hypothetical protein
LKQLDYYKSKGLKRATAKAIRLEKKKQQKRGLEVAKEVKKRKEKATFEYNKFLADLEAQKEMHDANNDTSPKESRPRNGRMKKSPHRNLFTNLSKKRVVASKPVPSRWRDQIPRVTPEVDNNQSRFKKNESTEDSMRWMSGRHFNKRFVEKFSRWSGSTLIAASDENLHHVGQDTSEVARLITLLEIQVKKAERQAAVIDISEGTASQ